MNTLHSLYKNWEYIEIAMLKIQDFLSANMILKFQIS